MRFLFWPFRRKRRVIARSPENKYSNALFVRETPDQSHHRAILELSALGLVLGILLIITIFSPEIFGITSIEISGNKRLEESMVKNKIIEVLNKTRFVFMSQKNIWLASVSDLKQALNKSFALDKITIQKKLPGKLLVHIIESYPAFAVKLDNGDRYLVTQEGRAAERITDPKEVFDFPVVAITSFSNPDFAKPIVSIELARGIPLISEKLRLFEIQPKAYQLGEWSCFTPQPVHAKEQGQGNSNNNINSAVQAVNTPSTKFSDQSCAVQEALTRVLDIRIQTEQGYWLVLSVVNDITQQLEKYKMLLNNQPDLVIREYVDLRVPERIYYK